MSKHKIYDDNRKNVGYIDTDKMEFIAEDGPEDRDTRRSELYIAPRSKRFFIHCVPFRENERPVFKELSKEEAKEFYLKYTDTDKIIENPKSPFGDSIFPEID